jgi:hypothetical protein
VGEGKANVHAPKKLSSALADTFMKLDSDMQEQFVASNGCMMNAGSTANAW